MRLYELRKAPEKNEKTKIIQELLKYSNDESMCVTFSTISKVGIHPKSEWATPNGVYAYPLSTYKDMLEQSLNSKTTAIFPYAADRVYVFVLKNIAKNPLNFNNTPLSDQDYEKHSLYAIQQVSKMENSDSEIINWYKQYMNDIAQKYDNKSIALYKFLRELTGSFPRQKQTNLLNKLYRTLGYDAIVDEGNGVIFTKEEPTQIVFLQPSAYKIQEMFYNDTAERERRVGSHRKRPHKKEPPQDNGLGDQILF